MHYIVMNYQPEPKELLYANKNYLVFSNSQVGAFDSQRFAFVCYDFAEPLPTLRPSSDPRPLGPGRTCVKATKTRQQLLALRWTHTFLDGCLNARASKKAKRCDALNKWREIRWDCLHS